MLLKNKTIKVAFISSLITAIITGTLGVLAVSLTAKDITFTSTDENWQVNNVEDAMNDLYNISTNCSSTSIINLGSDITYDLKTDYEKYGLTENQYQELTADNFIVSYNKISASGSGNLSGAGGGTANTINITKSVSYDNTTGVVKVSGNSGSSHTCSGLLQCWDARVSVSIQVYLVI